jgi:hypothetical protein
MTNSHKLIFTLVLCLTLANAGWGQASDKVGRNFSDAIVTDSTSTMIFPTTYNTELFTSNKTMTWGNYYANIIVYDFKADTYKKLFPQDVFIEAFNEEGNYKYYNPVSGRLKNFSRDWIFYMVKSKDFNGNGKVDQKDPSILYATNRKGEGLKSLTSENENVVSLTIYERLGFAIVRIQRDEDHDRDFKYEDKDFCLMKIDLATLKTGNKIEVTGNTN